MGAAIRKDAGPSAGDVHVDGPLGAGRKPRDRTGVEITKSAPASLYVYRQLLNADEVITWAKAQGFTTCLPADDMHCTITYSKAPVDWMAMGESWSGDEKGHVTVQPGGPRVVSQFNGGATVLEFACDTFNWRNRVMQDAGASYDFDGYKPHCTISYKAPDGLDLTKVEPYRGKLVFGPEIFQEIKEGGFDAGTIVEKREFERTCVVKADASHGLVFGFAIVSKKAGEDYYDSQGDHIPEHAMIKAAADFMRNSRLTKEMHAGDPDGDVVFAMPITDDIRKAIAESDETGLLIGMAPGPAALAKFRSGDFTGFSIGGVRLEEGDDG